MATTPTLDEFTRGYLECALWTSDPEPRSGGQWCESERWKIAAIDPDSVRQAVEDCAAFQADNRADLDATGATPARNGHDFWLTRNGHGAGYWDRGYGAAGDRLTDAAHVWGTVDVFGPEVRDTGSSTPAQLAAWDGVIYLQ